MRDDDGRHAEVCQTSLCTCMTLALSRKGSPINTSLSSAGLDLQKPDTWSRAATYKRLERRRLVRVRGH